MDTSLILRKAEPGDARKASELIYSTGPQSFNLVYGSQEKALALISKMFACTKNISSFEYSTVAVIDKTVVGVIVLFEKNDILETQARTGSLLLQMVGPLFLLLRMPVFIRQSRLNPEACKDELFVADVAVSPDARGRGVGRALMKYAEIIAREKELPKLSLGVSKGNFPAIGLYKSLGYKITEEHTDEWFKRRYGFPGVFKMVKAVKL